MAGTANTDDTPGIIAEGIVRDIAQRNLQPGDRVGAERELADNFGVSRWVVRKSIADLEAKGIVLRVTNGRKGGVYVAPRKVVRDLSELVGLPSYLKAQGVQAGTTVLGSRIHPAESDLARELEIDTDTWAYQIDRLRLADGLPLSIETCYFPFEQFPGLLDHSLTGSLYDLLETTYAVVRGDAVEAVAATAADKHQAAMLQVPHGHPLLVVRRTARLESGVVFEHSVECYRSDRVSLLVNTAAGARTNLQLS